MTSASALRVPGTWQTCIDGRGGNATAGATTGVTGSRGWRPDGGPDAVDRSRSAALAQPSGDRLVLTLIRVALSLLVLTFGLVGVAAGEIKLYAAGSLKEVMTELGAAYAQANGTSLAAQFGPSGIMRERIEKGEPVDVFASADMGHPLRLQQDGRASMVVFFTRNLLCATALPSLHLTSANLLDKLLDPAVKIGTSTPKADPAGDYTWAMFRIADKLRPGAFALLDAKAMQIYGSATNNGPVDGKDPAIAALASGKVDLTIGYCSGTRLRLSQLPGLDAVEIPQELSVGPEYGLALMKDASPEAARFALFVMSTQGQEILARFGFKPVAVSSSGG